jgi:peptidoglycan/xylan/chitin deacetylase (PgdA/CDA1 family)
MKLITACLTVCALILTSCSSTPVVTSDPPTNTVEIASLTPFQAITNTSTPTLTPLPSETPTPTVTETATPLPTPTITPTWAFNSTGKVTAPILLYHHIADIEPASRYYVSPQDFQTQLETLLKWGYTPVTVSAIVATIIKGGNLPNRPVVISFDDGKDIVTVDQLKEMAAAGWEIGSHSMSHQDLTKLHDKAQTEIGLSKSDLEKEIGVKVTTFAYPYGTTDPYLVTKVQNYGYQGAVGLGTTYEHSWATIFYLSRIEVESDYDLVKFGSILPWHDPPTQ